MIAISFRFLAGRYHATPWGRHVNEGAVEWPPSPWRILRALTATWKRTLPNLPQKQVEPILRALVLPPEFLLPPASTAHTRHYMPWFKKGPHDRTLVFDTFVAVPREAPLIAFWPDASLDPGQLDTLALILANINTLGRAESWCEAVLCKAVTGGRDTKADFRRCCPLGSQSLPSDHEIVRLLCPHPARAFDDDHVTSLATTAKQPGRKKQTTHKRHAICDPAWNLSVETLQLHAERWSDPPGSCWVPYARPRDCFEVKPHKRTIPSARPHIQVARYALDSTVLPLVTETLPVAEAARRRLMGIFGRQNPIADGQNGRSPTLSGKDEQGTPLIGHAHAYYLPTDEDGDGRLDHLTVFARAGFSDAERRALDELRHLTTGRKAEEAHPIRLLLIGMGTSEQFAPGPLRPSGHWASATPYLATRFAKTRGPQRVDLRSPEERTTFLINDLRAQIRDVLRSEEVHIGPVQDENGGFILADRWRPIQFKRFRRKDSDDGGLRLAGAFRLTFPTAIAGPIALGHSAHLGLGLFLPEA